ncbi:hypothetical protein AURDEDRAFT_124153 [Auricularia subglabra TFB-10046 SS5]|nr:hypothetical protein AURDEDRAFT_124153 [Auricularia subglabra TFB-10046 SS5]
MSSETRNALQAINPRDDGNITGHTHRNDDSLPKTPPKRDGKENVPLPDCDPAATPSPILSSRTLDGWCRPRTKVTCAWAEYEMICAAQEAGGERGLRDAIAQMNAAVALDEAATFALSGHYPRPDDGAVSTGVRAAHGWRQMQLSPDARAAGRSSSRVHCPGQSCHASDDELASPAGETAGGSSSCGDANAPVFEHGGEDDAVTAAGDDADAPLLVPPTVMPGLQLATGDGSATDGDEETTAEVLTDTDDQRSYPPYVPVERSPATRAWQADVTTEIWRRIREQPHDAEEVARRDNWILHTWIPWNAAQNAAPATADAGADDVFTVSKGRKRTARSDVDENESVERSGGSGSPGVLAGKRRRVQAETVAGTPARHPASQVGSSTGAALQSVSDCTATFADNEHDEEACVETLTEDAEQDEDEDSGGEWRGLLQFSANCNAQN